MKIQNQVRVADVMTRDVATISPATPVKEIARQIAKLRVSALPVVDAAGTVVGVVSEADLLYKEGREHSAPRSRLFESRTRRLARAKEAALTAGDLMTTPAITVAPATPLVEAARRMRDRGVKRLVVVDEQDRPVGIISRGDAIRIFLRPDADIRRTVAEDLAAKLLWLETRDLEVEVANGVVTLSGRLDRRSDVDLLARFAGDIEGVVGVVNRLSYAWDDRRPEAPWASSDLVTPLLRD